MSADGTHHSNPSDREIGSTRLPIVPTLVLWNTRLTRSLRFKFFLTGVAFPIACFLAIAFVDASPSVDSPWQSGQMEDYLIVLLSRPTVLVFVPLLLFCLVCMTVWCFNPRSSRSLAIQMGLKSGVILAAMFMLLLMVPTGVTSELFAIAVGIGLAFIVWLVAVLFKRMKRFTILHLIIATTIVAILLAAVPTIFSTNQIGEFLVGTILFIIGASPTLSFVTYCRVSVAANYLANQSGRPTSRLTLLASWVAWAACFFVTWKYALELMIIEYAKLPTTNPNCYVTSAAAYGHRQLVGSTIEAPYIGPVNLQMRRLKFFEIAIAAAFPQLQKRVRNIYDRIGPKMAVVCRQSVWFADVTFLMLKPIEWLAVGLQVISGITRERIQGIYR